MFILYKWLKTGLIQGNSRGITLNHPPVKHSFVGATTLQCTRTIS